MVRDVRNKELRDRAIIRPIKRTVEDALLDLPGVVAVDIGEKRVGGRRTGVQGIVVTVRHKTGPAAVGVGGMIPPYVWGIPIDVVEDEPVLHQDHRLVAPRSRRITCVDEGSLVVGGTGIAPCRCVLLHPPDVSESGEYRTFGTLGALVVARSEPGTAQPAAWGPAVMGLTTFDVACMDDAWSVGDQMTVPGGGRPVASLDRAALSGRVDAATVILADTTAYECAVAGAGPITGPGRARIGESVRKNGYRTGLTRGVVVSTDATLRVDHGAALGTRVLRDQIRVAGMPGETFAAPGDAGAVLINAGGRVVGLHVAGSRSGTAGFACPIPDVLHELDAELGVTTELLEA